MPDATKVTLEDNDIRSTLHQIRDNLAGIRGALEQLVHPSRAGKPAGDGVLRLLERIANAIEASKPKA